VELSPSSPRCLFDAPTDVRAIVRYYTFSIDHVTLIRQRRRNANRLGFAVHLAYLRFPGRVLGPKELRQRLQREQALIARLPTPNVRFSDAQTERVWAIVSAHEAGFSIRKIAGATGLSSSRIHLLLNAPEAQGIPVWLSQL
jgi:Domain of unknown function (DUF4158)